MRLFYLQPHCQATGLPHRQARRPFHSDHPDDPGVHGSPAGSAGQRLRRVAWPRLHQPIPSQLSHHLLPELPHGAAGAAVRGLILTVSHQNQIGQLYPQVLSLLVHGGLLGAVLTGEGCSDVAFPRDIGSPILTKHFTRWSNSPNCQVTGRKVRSWNVIVLFSHCPTPPDVFMIRRKLPRHKDAIYDR